MYKHIKYEKEQSLVTITLDRPDEANGINLQLAKELSDAAQQCSLDSSVKVVVITGSGRFFSAGGDVKSMAEFGDKVASGLKGIADELHKALSLFARMDAPLIVAVNGTAAGAGFSLAIAGDLVVAADSAKFTMAYTKVGLSPDGGSSYYLPRLIGIRKTQELMFTNRVLSAEEACDWGLVNLVVPSEQLAGEVRKLADMFSTGAKGSNAAIKRLLLETFDNGLETQLEKEGRAIALNSGSEDGIEGVAAFIDKRSPRFQ